MRPKRLLRSFVSTCLFTGFVACLLPARLAADVIISENSLPGGNVAAGFFGQEFATPTGPGWDNITFNWISPFPASPVAFGTLFVLTQEYLGTPAALSSSTPGFLAALTGISSGMYDFASPVTLLPSTTYWFYANGLIPVGAITGGSFPFTMYYAPSASANFTSQIGIVDFTLQGSPVPEPSSLVLLATVLAGLLGVAHRKRLS